jgi:hypothetical protein
MFKRMTTSLSKPPLAVFFMKDSWVRAILYLVFIPLLLIIPLLIQSTIQKGMSISRYDALVQVIQKEFTIQNTTISDGILTYESSMNVNIDYFFIQIGDQETESYQIVLKLEEKDIVLYMSNTEFDRKSYEEIDLMNHDFSDNSLENSRKLANSIKAFYNEQDIFLMADIIIVYRDGLYNYLFYVLLRAIMMMLFVPQVQIPYRYRFKLSIYLSTILIFVQLILALFGLSQLEFISIFALYFYHIWAYRSMKTIQKGEIL